MTRNFQNYSITIINYNYQLIKAFFKIIKANDAIHYIKTYEIFMNMMYEKMLFMKFFYEN